MFFGGDCAVIPGCAIFSLAPLAGRGSGGGGTVGSADDAVGSATPSPDALRAVAVASPRRSSSRTSAEGRLCSPRKRGEVEDGACANSRSHRYCATLVSWYSSTRMNLKRFWYCRSTSG